ncbi:hypothetical protein ACE6H2_016280 [Prunus campanulata]
MSQRLRSICFCCVVGYTFWFGGPLTIRVHHQGVTNLEEWLVGALGDQHRTKQDNTWVLVLFAYTCWGIWRSRCDAVFEGKEVCLTQTLVRIGK